MVSTKETAEMERAIAALALELPSEVWEDVRNRWHAARDILGDEVERLRVAAQRVVDHWDGACDDHPSYREWDFTEEIDRLKEALHSWRP